MYDLSFFDLLKRIKGLESRVSSLESRLSYVFMGISTGTIGGGGGVSGFGTTEPIAPPSDPTKGWFYIITADDGSPISMRIWVPTLNEWR